MQRVTFISAQPYLSLSFKELSITVQFVNHYYSTEDPKQVQILREYACINYVTVAEDGEKGLEELIELYNEAEEKIIREAEERAEARLEAEKQRKEDHEFYSLLRMSDKAYR